MPMEFGLDPNRQQANRRTQLRQAFQLAFDASAEGAAYRDKEAEADTYLAGNAPDVSKFPFIQAQVGFAGVTGQEVAQAFRRDGIQRKRRWAELEALRARHVAAIRAAAPGPDTRAAYQKARSELIAWASTNVPQWVDDIRALLDG